MEKFINACNQQLTVAISQAAESSKVLEFSFNTGKLVQYKGSGSEKNCPEWDRLGWQFEKLSSPLVYYFSIPEKISSEIIFQSISEYKNQQKGKPDFRSVPALRNNFLRNSTTLYVGCCASTKLSARMFWHFGYYKVGATQGLQLCHWAKPLNLELKLQSFSFQLS
jgi:hypothetical protein